MTSLQSIDDIARSDVIYASLLKTIFLTQAYHGTTVP